MGLEKQGNEMTYVPQTGACIEEQQSGSSQAELNHTNLTKGDVSMSKNCQRNKEAKKKSQAFFGNVITVIELHCAGKQEWVCS